MKFGRLLRLQSRDLDDWPLIQYSLLKKKIKARTTLEAQNSIFETGSFKRTIRDDMIKINNFWAKQQAVLLAVEEVAYTRSTAEQKAHEATCRRLVRWLTLNYLAVLKITKKHDKQCKSCLLPAISKVLVSQPFVMALHSKLLLRNASSDAADAGTSSSDGEEGSSNSIALEIEALLGKGVVHYFPKQLMQRINASELSFDPDLMFCDSKEFAASKAEHRAQQLQQQSPKLESTPTSAAVGAAVSSVMMLALALYVGLGV